MSKSTDILLMLLGVVSISGMIMFWFVYELIGSIMVLFSFGACLVILVITRMGKKKDASHNEQIK